MLRSFYGLALLTCSFVFCVPAFSNAIVPCSSLEVLQSIVQSPDLEASLVKNIRSRYPSGFTFQQNATTRADFYSNFKHFFRGTGANKTDREMLRFLLGDRSQEMRSWDYQRALETKLATGISETEAISQTDLEINKRISTELIAREPWDYVLNQMMGTAAGVRTSEKIATGIPFAPGNIQTAFTYARASLRFALRSRRRSLKNMTAFVTELVEREPRGLPSIMDFDPVTKSPQNLEYYVLSRVPARDVTSIYIG